MTTIPASRPSKCPICSRGLEAAGDIKYRPFCSRRCADVDLARWLGDGYAVAGDDVPPDAGEAENYDG